MNPPHVIVIGGGPAGIQAALAAALAGARTTLVHQTPIGGRAGWHSLLPSKVWLTAAETADLFHGAPDLGFQVAAPPAVDPPGLLARLRRVAESWNTAQHRRLVNAGVCLVQGRASLVSATEIEVLDPEGEEVARMEGDAIVVATGSVPIFPPEMRPDGGRILAPRFASHMGRLPQSIIVVGAGVTGSEFAYLFRALGVQVTWVIDEFGVLPTFAPEAGEFLKQTLVGRGVRTVEGQRAVSAQPGPGGVVVRLRDGQELHAEQAFVAIGRIPDLDDLDLANAGISDGRAGLSLDEYGRSTVAPSLYFVGDATGMPMVANRAMHQGWVAGRHAAGAPVPPFRPETVVAAVYTEPQVAQVGRVDDSPDAASITLPLAEGLRAHLLPHGDGFVKLVYRPDSGILLGGLAVGPHAAELLTPLAVALEQGMAVHRLAGLFPSHPTLGEVLFQAARQAMEGR